MVHSTVRLEVLTKLLPRTRVPLGRIEWFEGGDVDRLTQPISVSVVGRWASATGSLVMTIVVRERRVGVLLFFLFTSSPCRPPSNWALNKCLAEVGLFPPSLPKFRLNCEVPAKATGGNKGGGTEDKTFCPTATGKTPCSCCPVVAQC